MHLFVAIDFGDDGAFIIGRHRLIYGVKSGHDFLVQVLVALVNDAVCCAEDCSAIVLVGRILLLLDDVDCSYNQEQQKRNLPKKAPFSTWSGHLHICLVLILLSAILIYRRHYGVSCWTEDGKRGTSFLTLLYCQ